MNDDESADNLTSVERTSRKKQGEYPFWLTWQFRSTGNEMKLWFRSGRARRRFELGINGLGATVTGEGETRE